jgi:hypothetical protein
MPRNTYHFITRWRIEATLQEIAAIMADPRDLARWWPSVYLDVHEIAPGDERGIGKTINLYTKGWLPYTLRWTFRVAELRDDGVTIEADGDFVGRGIWTFRQDGPFVHATYDWKIRADKPLLRSLSWALKPIFALNHRWAMAQGERSLQLEVQRRRAGGSDRDRIPAPPQPTTTSSLPLLAGVGGIIVIAFLISRRRSFR